MDERVDRSDPRVAPDPVTRATPVTRHTQLGSRIMIGLILIALGGGAWYLWTHRQTQQAPKPTAAGRSALNAPQPVGVATIATGNMDITLIGLGTVTPLATVTVKTRSPGSCSRSASRKARWSQGRLPGPDRPAPLQAALEQAQGTLAKDQALLDQAQADLPATRHSAAGQHRPPAGRRPGLPRAAITGTVSPTRAPIDSAKLNLAYCHIVSPVDGRVGMRRSTWATTSRPATPTASSSITQMQPISVDVHAAGGRHARGAEAMRSGATLQRRRLRPHRHQADRHRHSSPHWTTQIDATTGTVKLRALFANADEMLFPHQFVNARLLVQTLQER